MSDSGGGNPLDVYRRKASFSVEDFRNLLDGEELVEFREHIWATMARDPLFASPPEELSLDQKRQLTFARMKRLFEYDFLPEDEFLESPMKFMMFCFAMWAIDGSLLPMYLVNNQVIFLNDGWLLIIYWVYVLE